MSQPTPPKRILAICVLLLAPLTSQAAFVVGNLSLPPEVGGFPLGSEFSGSIAASFETGSEASFLEEIVIRLNSTGGSPDGDLVVSLYRDDGTGMAFGSLLGMLTGSNPRPLLEGDYSYSAPGIILDPNTSYWVNVAATTGAGLYSVEGTTDGTIDLGSAPGWDKPLEKIHNGTSFRADVNTFIFGVHASPVPEPGVAVLVVLGGVALAVRRRRARG